MKSTTIESIACVKSVADLEHPSSTALSLIVPPAVTLQVMAQARAAGIKNFWLQPGCENEEVVAYIRDWARSDKSMNAILGGPCILVEGGDALRSCDRSRL
ncbi:hypothetical protein BDR26DRAFT_849792 [Obelidium mucronatum]|nr:hypothetical protein BDR26DRAFT_849792 [Obelidium mucronatum]